MDRRMTVRLGEVESSIADAVCERLGITPSEALRLALLALGDAMPTRLVEHPEVPVDLVSALDRLTVEVRRIGVNVNQIARWANTPIADVDFAVEVGALVAQFDELDAYVKEVKRHVGGQGAAV